MDYTSRFWCPGQLVPSLCISAASKIVNPLVALKRLNLHLIALKLLTLNLRGQRIDSNMHAKPCITYNSEQLVYLGHFMQRSSRHSSPHNHFLSYTHDRGINT